VAYPVDQSRRGSGGRIFAVFLAVLFLAVLGSSVGYLAGRQVQAHREAQQGGDQTGGDQTGGSTPSPTSSGKHCPTVSERDAGRTLIQILYIETAKSEAWICKDADGGLWYQGHGKAGNIDSNEYGILLPQVRDNGDGSYVASNATSAGTTKYVVSRKSLVIETPGQTLPAEPAINVEVG
jgi:hypothetical protein